MDGIRGCLDRPREQRVIPIFLNYVLRCAFHLIPCLLVFFGPLRQFLFVCRGVSPSGWFLFGGLLAFYPPHGFGCQAVKRLHGQRDMLFSGILDFVVADPPQGLGEQHHGRYPDPSDLGGVM